MADTAVAPQNFAIDRVFSRAFGVIGRNTVVFIVLSAVLTIPQVLLVSSPLWMPYLGLHNTHIFGPAGTVTAILASATVAALLYAVFSCLLQAALTYGTIVSLNGGRVSVGDCLLAGIRNAIPLTIIAVLAGLGIACGMVLLIVPGIILLLAWNVIAPVRVTEHTGIIRTFGRSAELTRNHRGAILAIIIVAAVISFVLGLVVRSLSGLTFLPVAGEHVTVTLVLLQWVQFTVVAMIGAALCASTYFELRVMKEGVGPEQLAAIFS